MEFLREGCEFYDVELPGNVSYCTEVESSGSAKNILCKLY